jgi:energy-coupling factor transport system substrate-specific component
MSVLPLGLRSTLVLTLATVAGLVMFVWPLLLVPDPAADHVTPPFVFLAMLPVVVLVVTVELSEGGMDAKALAMLGVLTAINAAMRSLGAGIAGVELVFFLLILAGRVYGAGFGFVLGCTSLFASALLTSGVGPWLPYQMLCSAWVGLFAGLLPHRVGRRPVRGRSEIAMLVVYGIVCAYGFGLLMNLSSWPYVLGVAVPGHEGTLAFVPGAPLVENLHRFLVYTLLTSTGGWDTGRAITNSVAIVVLGPAILATLRRSARRASYGGAATARTSASTTASTTASITG